MKSIAGVTIAALLTTVALTTATQPSAKLRRDGVLNLYPFPRVGRSYWRAPFEDELEHKPLKKSSLYAFPRVGRNDELLKQQKLYQMRSEPAYLRLEPGGYRQMRSELTHIRPELTQTRPELTQTRPELTQTQPEPAQIFSDFASNQQDFNSNRQNYNQNSLSMSQRSQFLQNQADMAQIRREISNLLENLYGKVKPRGTKRESEMEWESEGTEGMWFGPRLGRSDKSIEDDESPETKNANTISPATMNSEQNGERERVKRKI